MYALFSSMVTEHVITDVVVCGAFSSHSSAPKKILHHHPLLCLYNFLWCNVSHVYNKTDKRSKLWWKILKCISRSSSKRAGAEIWKRRRSGWRENKTESEISWQKQVAWEREKFLSEKFAIFLLLGMNLRTKYSFALWQTAMAWHWREKAKKQ